VSQPRGQFTEILNADRFREALRAKYRIDGVLGVGGMATVFRAHDLKHDRPVAVKLLHSDLARGDGARRFEREVRVAAQLNHRHILPLFDSGVADDMMYYVMPLAVGGTLRDRLDQEGQLGVREAIELAAEVSEGLAHAHARGVIHRDIKPENILLQDGHALIADFGIARAFRGHDVPSMTATGVTLGTPAYMSPEQATGERELDARSDVYSVACTLYEMLAGGPPFVGPSAYAVFALHNAAPRPRLTQSCPSAPPALDELLMRAMAIAPQQRVASCEAFAVELRAIGAILSASPALGSGAGDGVRSMAVPRSARWAGLGAVVLGVTLLPLAIDSFRTGRRDARESERAMPVVGRWHTKVGETYAVIASTDSVLVFHRAQARVAHTFDGDRWRALAVPDSFELRPYRGTLATSRVLATKRGLGSDGKRSALWWLTLSRDSLRPLAAVGPEDVDGPQPFWWYDGTTLVTWLESVRRFANDSWIDEPTGASGQVLSLWGRGASSRYAIVEDPSESILTYDGIGWQARSLTAAASGDVPHASGGELLADGSSVVFGHVCRKQTCQPMLLQEPIGGRTLWERIDVAPASTQPTAKAGVAECTEHLEFRGAAGLSRADFYVWGDWTFCRSETPYRSESDCPVNLSCVWSVRSGRMHPIPEFVGRTVTGIVSLRGSSYIVLDDGTVWREFEGLKWRVVSQVPDLPARRIAASRFLVVAQKGSRITYQPASGSGFRLAVRPLEGATRHIPSEAPLRELRIRDSTILMITDSGRALLAECGAAPANSTTGVTCGRVLALEGATLRGGDLTPDGTVWGLDRDGRIIIWSGARWLDTAGDGFREDSLWHLEASRDGSVWVAGRLGVAVRSANGRWNRLGGPRTDRSPRLLLHTPKHTFAVTDAGLDVWTDVTATSPVRLHRRVRGEAEIAALHLLPDGRLVAGFEHRREPGVGGWLLVWPYPYVADGARRVELPLNVDVTDLADDGTALHIVGRGGSMSIALSQLDSVSTRGGRDR